MLWRIAGAGIHLPSILGPCCLNRVFWRYLLYHNTKRKQVYEINFQHAIEVASRDLGGQAQDQAEAMPRGYSGRGMFGKECPAITGSWQQCQAFIAQTIRLQIYNVHNNPHVDKDKLYSIETTDAEQSLNRFIEDILQFSWDQMGRDGVVVYWPAQEYDHEPAWRE